MNDTLRRLAAVASIAALAACAGPSASGSASTTATTAGSASAVVSPAGPPGGTAGPSVSASPSPSIAATTAPATPTVRPSPSIPAGDFVNPVISTDFPDPFVINVGGTYHAYSTGLQTATSKDLVHWDSPESLTIEKTWAIRDFWAPEVLKTAAGFVMYYTGRSAELTRPDSDLSQCVGRAFSRTIDGPWIDDSGKPIVCQPTLGGTIDASPFRDNDGTLYLIYKNDGNCCGIPTQFFIQPLTPDGLAVTGKPVDMGETNDAAWEVGVVEAPELLRHGDTYYLFYSGNDYASENYAEGYATSKKVTGPYRDAAENPILHSNLDDLNGHPEQRAAGPGHAGIVTDQKGRLWLAYHAWDRDAIGPGEGGSRTMWLDELVFEGGKAVVKGPDSLPQPAP